MRIVADRRLQGSAASADRNGPTVPSRRFLVWGLSDTKTIRLFAALTGVFAGYLFLYLRFMAAQHYMPHDFFALWTYGRIALSFPASLLYDQGLLHRAQIDLGMPANWDMPFPYPPFALALFVPLSFLTPHVALAAWLVLSVGAYMVACCLGERRILCWILVLVAPTTTVAIACGQTGFLSAALMIGGLRLLERRPVLAGILFACLAYKAQLGFLLPAVLVPARQWRALAACAATCAGIVVSTTALLGVGIWSDFVAAIPAYQHWFDARSVGMRGLPTILSTFQQLGVRNDVAHVVQWMVTGAVFLLVCWLFRKGPSARAMAAVPVLTILGTPHSAIYDLPMVAGAVMMMVSARSRTGEPLHLAEIVILVALVSFPATVVIDGLDWPLGSPILALAAIVLLAGGDRHRGSVGRTAWSLPWSTSRSTGIGDRAPAH